MLQEKTNSRFKQNFDKSVDEQLDLQIQRCQASLYTRIKQLEKKLKTAGMQMQHEKQAHDEQIYANMQQSYYCRLKEVTKRLRQIERDQLERVKRIYGVEGNERLQENEELDSLEIPKDDGEQLQLQMEEEVSDQERVYRRQEIDKIVKQMNDLAALFRDVSTMVIEQGTLLDRIDFNVSDACKHVTDGNKELKKIIEAENSPMARYVMWCEVNLIVVCLFILLLKYSH